MAQSRCRNKLGDFFLRSRGAGAAERLKVTSEHLEGGGGGLCTINACLSQLAKLDVRSSRPGEECQNGEEDERGVKRNGITRSICTYYKDQCLRSVPMPVPGTGSNGSILLVPVSEAASQYRYRLRPRIHDGWQGGDVGSLPRVMKIKR